jgi:spore maturation protein CgeB
MTTKQTTISYMKEVTDATEYLICLDEVRGELDEASNQEIEVRIAATQARIAILNELIALEA